MIKQCFTNSKVHRVKFNEDNPTNFLLLKDQISANHQLFFALLSFSEDCV